MQTNITKDTNPISKHPKEHLIIIGVNVLTKDIKLPNPKIKSMYVKWYLNKKIDINNW